MPDEDKGPVVAVIGGGPAGLMAAGTAAARGATVFLFEKKQSCGLKLLITGSGRCNVTNSAPRAEFLEHYPENGKFLYPAYKTFFVDELKTFFRRYNLTLILEDNGKYFPETQSARSVLDILLKYGKEQHVTFQTHEPVENITRTARRWTVQTAQNSYQADAVIMATGGLSYPRTGSDGDGYRIAASLSHKLVAPRPALVPLEVANFDCAAISGISLADVVIELRERIADSADRKIAVQRGSLLFTHFGVSGPAVLFISRWLPADFDQKAIAAKYELAIDLLPSLTASEIERKLLPVFDQTPKRQLKNVLSRDFEIPHALAAKIMTFCELPEDILCQAVNRDYRKKLISALKSFDLTIRKTRGYQEAMVTAGGISTKEINPRTMESKLHPGLYFAGEIIDIDGFTGGFNLQAAFSTGYIAGKSAANRSLVISEL